MDETPFIFGRLADGEDFTDREKETGQLVTNFSSGINTVMISPRRWGKSSLVAKAAVSTVKKYRNIRFCFIDLFNVKSEEEFYQVFAQEILKSTSTKLDEILETTKRFLGRLIPNVTFSTEQNTEFALSFDLKEIKKNTSDILNLPERIAVAKKIKIIICIDEFQSIAEYGDSVGLQKKLRANWQKHKLTSYCLYGSKRHMMMDVFTSPSMPFYKFGDVMFLEKISEKDWVRFIVQRFLDTGKKIDDITASKIAVLCENHSYYVQQLAQQTWFRTSKKCNSQTVEDSFDSLLRQMSLLFQNITDSLTTTQVNYLKAILEETEQLSSKENLEKYQMGTSANVGRIKTALISKEILDSTESKIEFLDPMYKQWLKHYYFKLG